jgi:hypothetical protein
MKEVTETVVKGDDESPHLKDPQPLKRLHFQNNRFRDLENKG